MPVLCSCVWERPSRKVKPLNSEQISARHSKQSLAPILEERQPSLGDTPPKPKESVALDLENLSEKHIVSIRKLNAFCDEHHPPTVLKISTEQDSPIASSATIKLRVQTPSTSGLSSTMQVTTPGAADLVDIPFTSDTTLTPLTSTFPQESSVSRLNKRDSLELSAFSASSRRNATVGEGRFNPLANYLVRNSPVAETSMRSETLPPYISSTLKPLFLRGAQDTSRLHPNTTPTPLHEIIRSGLQLRPMGVDRTDFAFTKPQDTKLKGKIEGLPSRTLSLRCARGVSLDKSSTGRDSPLVPRPLLIKKSEPQEIAELPSQGRRHAVIGLPRQEAAEEASKSGQEGGPGCSRSGDGEERLRHERRETAKKAREKYLAKLQASSRSP